MSNAKWNGEQGGIPPLTNSAAGTRNKLPLIFGGVIVLVVVIGLVIFLLTRAGGERAIPPVSISPSASASGPGTTTSDGPAQPGLLASDLPATVGDWEISANSETVPLYTLGSKTISLLSLGDEMALADWALGLDNPVESAGRKVICGQTNDAPICLVETAEFGVLNAGGADLEADDLTAFADGLAAALN